MKRSSRTSLLRRILYSNLMVAGVAVVSLTALFLAGYRAEFERQGVLRASMLARFVARQSEVPSLVGDRGSIEKIAAHAAGGEDVLLVRIGFHGGRQDVIAHGAGATEESTKEAKAGARSRIVPTWVDASEEIRPVRSGLLDWDDEGAVQPESLGQVHVRISLSREEELFRRTVQQSIGIAGALLALVVAFQFFRMRNLFRPLGELIAFTRRVGTGALVERSRVDQVDEIADVAVAFNQMLDRLNMTTVSRDYVDNIIHSMAECLVVVGPDGLIRTVNEATLKLLGYSADEMVGAHGSLIIGDDFPAPTRTISAMERTWKTREGLFIPVLFSSAALRRTDSGEEGAVWLAQDITEQKRVREELIAARERYALAVAGANDGIWDWNILTGEVYYSPRWKSMLGYDGNDFPQRLATWIDLLHPDDRPRVESEMEAHRMGASAMFESEHRMRHRDGTYRWMLSRGLAVRSPDGAATRIAGSQTDITQHKVSDPLTGLPNRVLFTERLTAAVERKKRDSEYRFAVLFLDLDRFKMINDSLGHLAGDQLLIGIAERLKAGAQAEKVASEQTLARLSGDEFAVLLEGIVETDAAAVAASVGARLIRDLTAPFVLVGREIFTTVSIGVAPGLPGYSHAAEILRDADTAMYRAKAGGKARYEVFDSEMRAQAVSRLELDMDMRKALDRNEFLVYYQPKFSLPGEQLRGFEALVRWSHPTRGLIPPNEFIPTAEDTGLIVPLGFMVLREACRQMRQWQTRYPRLTGAVISVNISPRQLQAADLPDLVAEIIRETGIDPASVALELTETALMEDTEKAVVTLKALRDLGVGLQIDDFGTGYSSLNYLHRFPFDTVKIDRSFVTNLEREGGAAMVEAIVGLACNLGMKVTAEGVETSSQVKILSGLGCHEAQGYHFSRPVPANIAEGTLGPVSDSLAEDLGALAGAIGLQPEGAQPEKIA